MSDLLVAAFRDIHEKEDIEIGKALKKTIQNLPEPLMDLNVWFGSLPKVEKSTQRVLRNTCWHMAEASEPYACMLLQYGITPLTVFRARKCVGSLFDRLIRLKFIGQRIEIDREHLTFLGNSVDDRNSTHPIQKMAVQEIMLTNEHLLLKTNWLNKWLVPHLFSEVPLETMSAGILAWCTGLKYCDWRPSEDAASKLLSWLIAVAECQPLIFGGFEAKIAEGKMFLEQQAREVQLRPRTFEETAAHTQTLIDAGVMKPVEWPEEDESDED